MRTVFDFTFRQNTKGGGFVFVTYIIPVIISLICIAVSVFMAYPEDEEAYKSPVKKVYVDNQTEVSYMDFSEFARFAGEEYGMVSFVTGDRVPENEANSIRVIFEENDEEYAVRADIPEWSELEISEVTDINDNIRSYFEQLRTIDAVMKSNAQAGEQDMLAALMPVNVEYTILGDETTSVIAEILKMIGPLVIILILYMMVLVYGQSIGKIVISEKVSKLMETLLVTIKPHQLISGKILAMVVIAIIQILLWTVGLISGLGIGHIVAKSINPEYNNIIFDSLDLIRDPSNGVAFSVPALILTVVSLVIGFSFYCILSGLFACPVSKAEDLASATGIFQFLVIIGFLASYMLPLQGIDSPVVMNIMRIVPFSSAFMLPGDILFGNIGIGGAIGFIILLIIFTGAVAWYAGRLYRNQVFYNNTSKSVFKKLFM